jgi:hypothetical protein
MPAPIAAVGAGAAAEAAGGAGIAAGGAGAGLGFGEIFGLGAGGLGLLNAMGGGGSSLPPLVPPTVQIAPPATIPAQTALLNMSPAQVQKALALAPQLGVQSQLAIPGAVPVSAALTPSQLQLGAATTVDPAASAAGAGVAPVEQAVPQQGGPVGGRDFGQSFQGQPVSQPQSEQDLQAQLERNTERIKELKSQIAQKKLDAAAELQIHRQRSADIQAHVQRQQQKGTGQVFAPGTSTPLKGILLLDLINKLNRGGTPAILQGRAFGGSPGLGQATQPASRGTIEKIAGVTKAINVATARVSSYSDPDIKEAVAKLETQKIASVMNIPPGDPLEDQIGVLVRQPSPLPDLETIRTEPELKPLWNLVNNEGSTGKQILDGYTEAQPIFDRLNEENEVADGARQKLDNLVKWGKDNPEKFKGIDFDNLTTANIRELNNQAPMNGGKVEETTLQALRTSQLLQNGLGVKSEETAEAEEKERVKRESNIKELRATESQFTRDIAGLVEDGIIDETTANALRAQKAVTAARGKGLQITFDEDGKISSITEGGIADPSTARGLETMQDRLFQVTFADHLLGEVADNIKSAPDEAKAGLTGILKRKTQTGIGIVADIDRQLNTNLQSYVTNAKASLEADYDSNSIKDQKLDSRVEKFLSTFDPNVATLKQVEFLIAYHTAGGSKRGDRSPTNEDVKLRQANIGLSKVKDADSILAAIEAARVETGAIGRNLSSRITARGGTPIPFEPGKRIRKSTGLPAIRHFDLTGDSVVEVPGTSP